eukprot:scaffold36963_cov63-Phaeocystis_antarctica.AAC.5
MTEERTLRPVMAEERTVSTVGGPCSTRNPSRVPIYTPCADPCNTLNADPTHWTETHPTTEGCPFCVAANPSRCPEAQPALPVPRPRPLAPHLPGRRRQPPSASIPESRVQSLFEPYTHGKHLKPPLASHYSTPVTQAAASGPSFSPILTIAPRPSWAPGRGHQFSPQPSIQEPNHKQHLAPSPCRARPQPRPEPAINQRLPCPR